MKKHFTKQKKAYTKAEIENMGIWEGLTILVKNYGFRGMSNVSKIKDYGKKIVGRVRCFIYEDDFIVGLVIRTKKFIYDFYRKEVFWVYFKNIQYKILKHGN